MGSLISRAPQVLKKTSRKEIEKRIDYVMVKTWGARESDQRFHGDFNGFQ
jgi:hypothetical protein